MELYNWKNDIEEKGALKNRKNISLILINEEGDVKCRWEIFEAWPTKYSSTGSNAKENSLIIESLEIVHESIKRTK